jgi:hypothetical protein
MLARRFPILCLVILLAACADDLAPLTAHWNQAQLVMLKRVAELKASAAEVRTAAGTSPAMGINNWQSDEVKTSLRGYEQGVAEVEQLVLRNDEAVAEALHSGKLAVAKPAIAKAEADFDAAVARLYPVPKQIHSALAAMQRR